jgi:hypothetical protein
MSFRRYHRGLTHIWFGLLLGVTNISSFPYSLSSAPGAAVLLAEPEFRLCFKIVFNV